MKMKTLKGQIKMVNKRLDSIREEMRAIDKVIKMMTTRKRMMDAVESASILIAITTLNSEKKLLKKRYAEVIKHGEHLRKQRRKNEQD